MIQACKEWLNKIPLNDEVEHQLSVIFQIVLIAWLVLLILVFILLSLLMPLLQQIAAPVSPSSSPPSSFMFIGPLVIVLSPIIALVCLRRGYFRQSVVIACSGILFAQAQATYALGVNEPVIVLLFQIPLVIAGLLGGRRLLFGIACLNILIYTSVGILQMQTPPLAGPPSDGTASFIPGVISIFVAVTLLLAVLLERVGTTLTNALKRSSEHAADLQSIRESLEIRVADRTADLQHALGEVETRALKQAELLEQIEFQQATIRNLSVPIIPVNDYTLVLPLVGVLDSARLLHLQSLGLEAVEHSRVRTLILDITGVPLVDAQVARGIIVLAQSVRLLGADVTLVGVRPEVAETIVGLGIDLKSIRTFSTLQAALVGSK